MAHAHALTIAFFGRLAESVGREVSIDVDMPCNVADLRERLADSLPQIGDDLINPRIRVCVADTLVPDDFVIAEKRRIEILSPLSGG